MNQVVAVNNPNTGLLLNVNPKNADLVSVMLKTTRAVNNGFMSLDQDVYAFTLMLKSQAEAMVNAGHIAHEKQFPTRFGNGIVVRYSALPNPERTNHQPVINPKTGEIKMHNGRPYYRETAFVHVTPDTRDVTIGDWYDKFGHEVFGAPVLIPNQKLEPIMPEMDEQTV
jgi:hypothetical protein